MDRSERYNPRKIGTWQTIIQSALDQKQADIWTALPAFINSFDPAKGTVVAQPTIQAQVRQPNGTWVDTTLPLCLDCPVLFPGGGGYTLTFPLVKGDEGLLVFASRCIDSWWQSGGIQKQAELRMHDLSDGFFLPSGGMSNSKVPSAISTTGLELRSNDGKNVIRIGTTDMTLSINNANTVVVLDDAAAKISLEADAGATKLEVDGTAQKVNIIAVNGLWVNGVLVTVP